MLDSLLEIYHFFIEWRRGESGRLITVAYYRDRLKNLSVVVAYITHGVAVSMSLRLVGGKCFFPTPILFTYISVVKKRDSGLIDPELVGKWHLPRKWD